jgi:spoIIIJ-associated protein
MTKDLNKVVTKKTEELLTLMGITTPVEVTTDKESDIVNVEIKADDETGLLIGHHGQTIFSIQSIIALMVRQEVGEWVRIVVNVGDYREKQEEHLVHLAQETLERARQTGEPQPIYSLTPAQRRIVHMELSKDPDVVSESTGEGDERYLVVSIKK